MKTWLSIYRHLLRLEFWRWKRLNYSVLTLFVALLALDTAIQLLFKVGVTHHGVFPLHSLPAAAQYLRAIANEPLIWLGAAGMVLAFLTWLTIIARIELSKAHPATSFSYVTVTLASGFFLHEEVSALKIVGILFIILGVYLVAE
jgi:drug/metabolite transporter (DMT)-like permease